MSGNDPKQTAVRLMKHYLRLSSEGGYEWNSDCDAEAEALVDAIVEAAALQVLVAVGAPPKRNVVHPDAPFVYGAPQTAKSAP